MAQQLRDKHYKRNNMVLFKDKIIKYLLVGLVLLMSSSAFSQQQYMFTQYMFNGLAINPAYAGSHESLTLTTVARKQWVGFPGAPSTQTFSAHSPLKFGNASVGGVIYHDKIGALNQTGLNGIYAYRIPIGKGKLSMAIQGGFYHYATDYTGVKIISEGGNIVDPEFQYDISKFVPNFGAGLYYHTSNYYVGFSIPQLINVPAWNSETGGVDNIKHYFIHGGYVFDINRDLKLKPNFLIKAVTGAPVEFDLNANLLIKNRVWVGFSYRSLESIDAIVQLQLNNELQIGYSYDFGTGGIGNYNSGSHELMLSYRIKTRKEIILTPRYF